MANIIILFIGSIFILMCACGIAFSVKNYRIINASYVESTARSIWWLDFCQQFLRTRESLLRKNDGENPNNIIDSVQYVDYIGDIDFFF